MDIDRTSFARKRLFGSSEAGFTLIELLVVIALTLVLMVLLFGPMIAGLRYTSQAQTSAAAQDGQRLLLRQIMRDLASAAAVRDTHERYLNCMVIEKANATDSQGGQSLVHIYHAYSDLVPPMAMCQDSLSTSTGTCVETNQTIHTDPTTNQNLVQKTSATGVTYWGVPDPTTPLAPGSSFTRYFIGLRYPFNFGYVPGGATPAVAQPYSSIYDGQTEEPSGDAYYNNYSAGTLSGNQNVSQDRLNNPYVLYVANVSPYMPHSASVNTDLFQTSDGTATGTPVLDDPDFFRIVTDNDYLPETDPAYDPSHPDKTYGSVSETAAHNQRVYNWYKVAHQVMAGREYDLLGYARVGGNVDWAQPSATVPNTSTPVADPLTGQPYSGWMGKNSNAANSEPFDYDMLHLVNNKAALMVRSLTSILPTGSTGQGGQTLTPDDTSQGASQVSNSDPTQQYIPTSYTISSGQIQGTPNITIQADPTTAASNGSGVSTSYYTGLATPSTVGLALVNSSATVASTDLIEYLAATSAPVYDVTQQAALVSASPTYVAFSFDKTTGRINFSVPSIPPISTTAGATPFGGNADPGNIVSGSNYNVWWYTTLDPTTAASLYDSVTSDLVVVLDDATQFPGSVFTQGVQPSMRVVVNSERVRGPDRTKPPPPDFATYAINLPLVTYTRVPFGAHIGPNQYSIEYRHAVTTGGLTTYHPWIHLGDYSVGGSITSDNSWQTFLTAGQNIAAANSALAAARTILVSYNIQNNVVMQPSETVAGQYVHTNVSYPATVVANYASSATMQVTLGFRVYDAFSGTASFLTSSNDVPVGNGTR